MKRLAPIRAWLVLVDEWLERNEHRLTRLAAVLLVLSFMWFVGRSL